MMTNRRRSQFQDPLAPPFTNSPRRPGDIFNSKDFDKRTVRRLLSKHSLVLKTGACLVLFTWVGNFIATGGLEPLDNLWRRLNPAYGIPRSPEAPSFKSYMKCLKDPSCTRFPKKNNTLPHDYPGHPWHWTRENEPDPELSYKRDCKGSLYQDLYDQFHEHGYALFESCSLKRGDLLDQVAAYTRTLVDKVGRVQNAMNLPVRQMAVDGDTLEFLQYLHGGRPLFPFQTRNFPKGTQQALHSDLVHFDTSPRTLMTAAWVALEDMSPDSGPLQYVPGSHLYGTWDYDEIGLHFKHRTPYTGEEQGLYGSELARLTKAAGLDLKLGSTIKRGQTFVWAAGLVHGGSTQTNPKLTRLSQVSHYFFEGSDFYWQPRTSDLAKGQIRHVVDDQTTNLHRCSSPEYAPTTVHSCAESNIQAWLENCYEKSFFGLVKKKCPSTFEVDHNS